MLITVVSLQFQPIPLQKRRLPFDDPAWLFELKYDPFRALAVIENGRCQLLSHKWEFLPLVFGSSAAHRGLYTEYKIDRARRRDCLPGQERAATVSRFALPTWR